MFNLTVDEAHTFYVGNNGWLVHNTGGCPTLLEELAQNGVKHNPSDIVRIARDGSGKVVFLENGTTKAGLQHIVDAHAADFANVGIDAKELPDFIIKAVSEGKIVGQQGSRAGRDIYEVTFGGKTYDVAVSVGNNGFIVGANPVGRPR